MKTVYCIVCGEPDRRVFGELDHLKMCGDCWYYRTMVGVRKRDARIKAEKLYGEKP